MPENFAWISADNKAVPFTLEDLQNLASLIAAKVQENTFKALELKKQVDKAKTHDKLFSINFN